jgi:hypothetical protein
MLLTLNYGFAEAEWEPAVNHRDNTKITYVDPNTIRISGGVADMWTLTDLKMGDFTGENHNDKRYYSQKDHREYNCNTKKMRLLFASFHSENMGKGEVVFKYSGNQPWDAIPQGSVAEAMKKIACGEIVRH